MCVNVLPVTDDCSRCVLMDVRSIGRCGVIIVFAVLARDSDYISIIPLMLSVPS